MELLSDNGHVSQCSIDVVLCQRSVFISSTKGTVQHAKSKLAILK